MKNGTLDLMTDYSLKNVNLRLLEFLKKNVQKGFILTTRGKSSKKR